MTWNKPTITSEVLLPKSHILNTPFSLQSTFSSLISRCAIPFECMYSRAEAVSSAIFRIVFYGRFAGYCYNTFRAVLRVQKYIPAIAVLKKHKTILRTPQFLLKSAIEFDDVLMSQKLEWFPRSNESLLFVVVSLGDVELRDDLYFANYLGFAGGVDLRKTSLPKLLF